MLHSLWLFLLAALPFLLGVAPSVIVGLTPYPKAQGIVSAILKVLNMASLLVHSDSPGSLKLPLTMSPSPVRMMSVKAPRGKLRAFLPFLVIGSLFATSCACTTPTNAGKWYCKAETALIDCSTAAAQPAIATALADVEAALAGNTINWTALAMAEATHGIGVVACVIQRLDAAAASNSKMHKHATMYFATRKLLVKK